MRDSKLTFRHGCVILVSEVCDAPNCLRVSPTTPPRVTRETSAISRISCSASWPFLIRKSRPHSTQRSERKSGSEHLRLPLPALQTTVKVRRVTFLPSCLFQSDVNKSDVFQQSETLLTGNDHRHASGFLLSRDCYNGIPVHPSSGTGEMVPRKHTCH